LSAQPQTQSTLFKYDLGFSSIGSFISMKKDTGSLLLFVLPLTLCIYVVATRFGLVIALGI
jgi:hypothetical protein